MKKIVLLLFAAAVFVCKTNFVIAQIDINDSLALVDLYDSTGGPNWTNHDNWLTSAPISTWYGIGVSGNRVFQIFFQNNNLTGTLPISFGNLTALYSLQISGSHLT